MSELMGLVQGEYDAKKEGFIPGGVSIHNCMTPHGPDQFSYEKAIAQDLKPEVYLNSLAFMFETRDIWNITEQAMSVPERQRNYADCWKDLKPNFI
jgi:homogentisate 1,2-dioxygenase